MAARWMVARNGLGFSPGGPKYIVTRGLVPTGPVATGFANKRIHVGRRRAVRYREWLLAAGFSLLLAIVWKGV